MNRIQLRRLADLRVAEAQTLLAAGNWSGAYYLIGYAVEFGLKACVLAHVESTGAIFREKKFSEKCWTHDLVELAKVAEIYEQLKADMSADPALLSNWMTVKDWTEAARYEEWPEPKALKLFSAVTDRPKGVLPWIEERW